jgi:hypothetical protein
MIAGRFEPLGPVTWGKPIKARDLATAQTVVLTEAAHLDPRVVGVFHPALVTIFAIVEHEGHRLAAAEFVQGGTLASVLRGAPCHPRRAAEIVCALADGMAELHASDIRHGGVGLDSVILTSKGKARLTLTSVVGGDETADINALRRLLLEIGGRSTPESDAAQSAAVLAAALR